jgi:hypothetical protein
MALQYSPKIVQDSLVMCLDASQNKSYPTDLPVKNGLVMWMDAADDTTFSYSSGTTVSQWRDKSGFNYHMVPVSAGPTRNAFLNSRKVIACTTSQQIWNSSINLVTSAYTIFCVTRLSGINPNRVLSTLYTGATGTNWLLGHWGGHYNQYYAEGWVQYQGYPADNTWRMYMGDWSGSSTDLANLYSNGTAITTNSNGANAGPLGLGVNISSEVSTCEAAEIIVFNRLLSATERRLVHTYLGQKWGISNTDRSIVDLVGNNTLLFGTGNVSYMPYFDFYNKGALKFDGSNDFAGVASTTTYGTNTTWEAWVNRSVSANEFNMFMGAYLPYFGLRADGSVIFSNTINSTQQTLYSAGFTSSNDTWYYLSFTTDYNGTNTTARIYINGVLNNSATFTGAQSAANEYFGIGDGRGTSSWYPFNGKVSNVKVYNRTLSATEISQNYEAQKSKFANTIVQQGLVLNLDAGNPYSYGGAGTTFYDVSGNSFNGTLTNSPTYSSDNNGLISFNGSSQYVDCGNVLASLTDLSLECFVKFGTQSALYGGVISKTLSNANGYEIRVDAYTSTTTSLVFRYVGDNAVVGFSTNFTNGVWYHVVTTGTNGSQKTYVNGNQVGSATYALTPSANSNSLLIAKLTYSGLYVNMTMGYTRIYNRVLSAAEVLQNYNATKGRFGL